MFSTKDGWVTIMQSGIDAVGIDQEPERDYSKWNVLYFIAFLLLAGFIVLNMLVGIVVENFHKCQGELRKERNTDESERNEVNDRSRTSSGMSFHMEDYSIARILVIVLGWGLLF